MTFSIFDKAIVSGKLLFIEILWPENEDKNIKKMKINQVPIVIRGPNGAKYRIAGFSGYHMGHFVSYCRRPDLKWWSFENITSVSQIVDKEAEVWPTILIYFED